MREWNGARWWKCDFHSHTPASSDYGKGPDQETLKNTSPRQWLLDYMHSEVDCVAITDHNSGVWVERVKSALDELESEKPEGYRPLHVFPGVEISVQGSVHLLAILGSDKTTSDIDTLLGAIEFPTAGKGSSDQVTVKSFVEVVEAINEAGGIAIPAHADCRNGVFELPGSTLSQVLDSNKIIAMELTDLSYQKPQIYIDKDLGWTAILGSDAHHPSGGNGQRYPGSHYTWIKMGTPSIEGLRLALLDGVLSVRRSDEYTDDPNAHSSLTLDSLEVSQGRYMGRSQSFTFGFNPWFNAIIGGRGTGKSTAVEFLRIALQRFDELPVTLRVENKQYRQIYHDRAESGLLTSNASLTVTYLKDGERYRIQWKPTEESHSIEREENSTWVLTEGDINQRFPVRMYSPQQVFQLATSPDAMLKVINDTPEVKFQAWTEEWKQEESRFLSLRANAREIEAGLDEEQRLRGELDDVKRKLAVYEQSGHAEILKSYQHRSRQDRVVDLWEEDWADVGERLRKIAIEIVPDILDNTTFDSENDSDVELQKVASIARERMIEIRESVETLASLTDGIVEEWRTNRNESSWAKKVNKATSAYRELQKNLDREGAGDPGAYGEFVKRRQDIEQRLKVLDEDRKQVSELNQRAVGSLNRLQEIRRNLTDARHSFLEHVLSNNQYVRIRIKPYGARESVEKDFRRLLQKEDGSFENDIGTPDGEGLLGELYRYDDVEDFERNIWNIKACVRKIALGEPHGYKLADQRFANHLSKLTPEVFDRLDLWFPEDSLQVEYSAAGDGQNFRSIQEGSPGQRTAALLAFLLSYGDEPLILDQPEDDLDNHLIYDLIVNQLRVVKGSRQVIVVTHNANIVVNGDAELVVALSARGGETQKECEGCLQVQTVRDTICEIMEGGRKAFEDRYRRIAL